LWNGSVVPAVFQDMMPGLKKKLLFLWLNHPRNILLNWRSLLDENMILWGMHSHKLVLPWFLCNMFHLFNMFLVTDMSGPNFLPIHFVHLFLSLLQIYVLWVT
jgi:hypothetical protein